MARITASEGARMPAGMRRSSARDIASCGIHGRMRGRHRSALSRASCPVRSRQADILAVVRATGAQFGPMQVTRYRALIAEARLRLSPRLSTIPSGVRTIGRYDLVDPGKRCNAPSAAHTRELEELGSRARIGTSIQLATLRVFRAANCQRIDHLVLRLRLPFREIYQTARGKQQNPWSCKLRYSTN